MDSADVPSQNGQFTDDDLEKITRSTFVKQLEFHQAINSTNDRALQLAGKLSHESPLLVLAESQTDGRGRGANLWWARPGALTFSLVLQTEAARLPPQRWPQVSLTAGLAVCEAIEESLAELPGQKQTVQLKWPNDVYVRQRKACGILVECPPEQKQSLVIGVGINVNNSAQLAPGDLQSSAIAMCDAAKREFTLAEVLVQVLARLQDLLAWIGHRDEELRTRWRERCLLTGRTVHLDSPTRRVVGLCRGIDDEGALVIETAKKAETCYAGAVTRF